MKNEILELVKSRGAIKPDDVVEYFVKHYTTQLRWAIRDLVDKGELSVTLDWKLQA